MREGGHLVPSKIGRLFSKIALERGKEAKSVFVGVLWLPRTASPFPPDERGF